MDKETKRILEVASGYPLLGIDAERARQIVDECNSLQRACDLAAEQFSESDVTRFAALFALPMSAAPLQ